MATEQKKVRKSGATLRSRRRTPGKKPASNSAPATERKLASLSASALQAELERRLASLQAHRESLIAEIDALDLEIASFDGGTGSKRRSSRTRSGTTRKRPQNSTNLVQALSKLLTGRTLSVTEMAEEVQQAGYRTSSPNFRTIVNQTLINNKKLFKRVSRGRYTARTR